MSKQSFIIYHLFLWCVNKSQYTFYILMRITVTLYQIVPRHLILQRIVLLIFPKSEPGQLQKIYATAWKIKKNIIWEIEIRENAHSAIHLRTINQFLKLVYLRKWQPIYYIVYYEITKYIVCFKINDDILFIKYILCNKLVFNYMYDT